MKTVRLVVLLTAFGAVLSGGLLSVGRGQTEVPAAAREVLTQFADETADLDRKTEAEFARIRDRAVEALKKVQDDLCQQGKLDEAAYVRDLIGLVQSDAPVALSARVPSPGRKVYRDFEEEVAVLTEKAEAEFQKRRERAVEELKKIQESFSKAAKLEEALVVREQIQALGNGKPNVQPDPGNLAHPAANLGKTFYHEVVGFGANAGYAIYGADVYAAGSHLGTAAVHAGVLKEGQRGVVRVTIVPSPVNYPGTTRNGVTSNASGQTETGYRVERAYPFQFQGRLAPLPVPVTGPVPSEPRKDGFDKKDGPFPFDKDRKEK